LTGPKVPGYATLASSLVLVGHGVAVTGACNLIGWRGRLKGQAVSSPSGVCRLLRRHSDDNCFLQILRVPKKHGLGPH